MIQPHRVVVIGGTGALGSLVAHAFTQAGWDVTALGRRTSPRRIDLEVSDTVAPALAGADLVVNTVPHPGLLAERMVLEGGGALLNLSAQPISPGALLRAATSAPVGTVVLHAGLAPGVTNLVAADLLARHPEADELEMVFTVSASGSGGAASADFAHRGLTALRRHRTARVTLAPPFGDQRVLGFAEPEAGWLSDRFDGVRVHTYIHLTPAPVRGLMLLLNSLRLIGHLPRPLLGNGRHTTVEDASREPVAHKVAVRRRGRLLASRDICGHGDFRMAAASAVVLGTALLRLVGSEPAPPGVWAPEEVFSLGRVGAALGAAGIAIAQPSPISSRPDLDQWRAIDDRPTCHRD